jgi:hypothetical protein
MCGYIAMVVILLFVVVAVSTEYPQKSWNSAGHKLIKMLFYDFYDYLCMIYNLTSICLNFTRITYSNHFPLSPMLKQFTMVTAILDFRSSHIQIHIRSTNLQVCLQLSDVVLWRSFYFSIALLLHTIFCVDGLYGYPNDTKTANCKYDHSRMNETSITPRQLQKVVRCVVSDQAVDFEFPPIILNYCFWRPSWISARHQNNNLNWCTSVNIVSFWSSGLLLT